MYMHMSGVNMLSFQSSVGGAIIILAPADTLSWCGGPLSALNISSYAWPMVLNDPSVYMW